jgi:type I restriction enzyme S subunit
MVNMREIFAFDRIGDQSMECVPLTADEQERFLLAEGDLLFARQSLVREGAGRVVYVEAGSGPRTWEGHLIRVRLDKSRACPLFYFYFFRSPMGRRLIDTIVEQVAAAGIRASDLGRLQVPVPSVTEQRAIGEVLGAIDAKIRANHRLASKLYELALAVGVSVFTVAEGPLVSLDDVALMTKGVSYRSSDLVPGLGWLIGLKCVARRGGFRYDGIKPYSGPAKPSQVVAAGDVLVAQTDLTQRAEVIGRPLRLPHLTVDGVLVASLDFTIVRPRSNFTREMLLALLSTQDFRDHALSYCNGTTVLHMNSTALPAYEFRMPPSDALVANTELLGPMFRRADLAVQEADALATLRDAIFPGILSGVLRLRDAAGAVEVGV